jgi:hypothetical protein
MSSSGEEKICSHLISLRFRRAWRMTPHGREPPTICPEGADAPPVAVGACAHLARKSGTLASQATERSGHEDEGERHTQRERERELT